MGYAGDITRMNIKAPSTIENKGPLSAAGGVVLDAPPEHESFDEKIARLKEQLKSVPTLPGRLSMERRVRAGNIRWQGEAAPRPYEAIRHGARRARENSHDA